MHRFNKTLQWVKCNHYLDGAVKERITAMIKSRDVAKGFSRSSTNRIHGVQSGSISRYLTETTKALVRLSAAKCCRPRSATIQPRPWRPNRISRKRTAKPSMRDAHGWKIRAALSLREKAKTYFYGKGAASREGKLARERRFGHSVRRHQSIAHRENFRESRAPGSVRSRDGP